MSEPFDAAELLASVDGDREFLAETVEMLATDAPVLVAGIRAAHSSSDAAGVAENAHTLKGMIANFRAEPARLAALELESLGKQGPLENVPAACDRLQSELSRLLQALERFLQG